MHAPDGFLTAPTAIATGAISAGTLGLALKHAKEQMTEKMVPLAGITA
ncbi:MAG: energy-coupling factor ABC transporter permease, partial [Acidimicrobiia bacterium]|nr:energy-coupling factor ABC transporter permease [Acidimicrobiia bacterium]